jgi:hypothetical protein
MVWKKFKNSTTINMKCSTLKAIFGSSGYFLIKLTTRNYLIQDLLFHNHNTFFLLE